MHSNEETKKDLSYLGIIGLSAAYWNLSSEELTAKTLELGQGTLADTGALVVDTGAFTGRSPKDRFIVSDRETMNTVWWKDINTPITPEAFDLIYGAMQAYLSGKELFIRDVYASADDAYRLRIRVLTELPWQNLFARNLFIQPDQEALASFTPDWHVISIPSFEADPIVHGTRQKNFTVINFTKRMILIGGSAYTGEIKKGIFSVLNYLLPEKFGTLSMHASANRGEAGDTAIFFGLSGTGKTTLSADPARHLIGDDEHGWGEKSVFNFEGGCYAKCINLSPEKEPAIFGAIHTGALLENVRFYPGTTTVNYDDTSKTENTRVAYPLSYIENAAQPSVGPIPKNIFFLSCDALGVLPPVAKLSKEQAMYYFLSGYTAKVAGTEVGITEPELAFSACFGKAFLPLHPAKYAALLGKKLDENPDISVWLVNTGWSGGPYGTGERMSLPHTRAIITAALSGTLAQSEFDTIPVFNFKVPRSCPGVPSRLLMPKHTWQDPAAYEAKARELAEAFIKNFANYTDGTPEEIRAAGPSLV